MLTWQKKNSEALGENKLDRAKGEVPGFAELIYRFERSISILGRSTSTFKNYALHVAAIAVHFGKVPTELDPEQLHEYLFLPQKRSKIGQLIRTLGGTCR
ncbi:hypothetical protein NF867_03800 [Solitalea sp. MAHUQ-68]|uniref:Integrase SAM-like N-terminal domain-containing protein n=1 Tax=Solitalea agri TaxID=2953739 RepID=A0A9X2JBZ6_9SPHI|nr:hypothetical protein [Solitalea agri]MCO4291984.1 hypothetical protein [Solitalea agri]